jgi:beta-mannosidase
MSGSYFVFEINDRPVFCKGGNFVPADTIFTRIGPERYEALIDLALEQHFNILRVWGGGLYESDDFYEMCDARGVMVWQEFIFACNRYPGHLDEFYHEVRQEAVYQIRRLASHPSLLIWCGNNEMEQGAMTWEGWDRGSVAPDAGIFHRLLPMLMQIEDPTRFYWPSSPYSPNDRSMPNRDDMGDQHPWSIGFHDCDFRKYREMISRFPNEGGILGPNALPTMLRALPEGMRFPGSFAWELHDNSIAYWNAGSDPHPPDAMLELWLGRKLESMSIEDYAYWGGVVQGAGLAEYIKNFRRRMFDSGAAIFWMYNDCWPTVRSWTTIDYSLRRTPAFWPVRRAFASVTVVVVREDAEVHIYGVTDGPEVAATLRYGVLRLAGGYPMDHTEEVVLRANASTRIATFPAEEWDRLGVTTHTAFAILMQEGREIARDNLFLPLFREIEWPEATVRVTRRGNEVVFESDTYAWRVCLDLDGETPLPDNFFDVYPGVPTVLDWLESLGEPTILRVGNAL